MRNYARFQVKTDVFWAISVIKDLTCVVDIIRLKVLCEMIRLISM